MHVEKAVAEVFHHRGIGFGLTVRHCKTFLIRNFNNSFRFDKLFGTTQATFEGYENWYVEVRVPDDDSRGVR